MARNQNLQEWINESMSLITCQQCGIVKSPDKLNWFGACAHLYCSFCAKDLDKCPRCELQNQKLPVSSYWFQYFTRIRTSQTKLWDDKFITELKECSEKETHFTMYETSVLSSKLANQFLNLKKAFVRPSEDYVYKTTKLRKQFFNLNKLLLKAGTEDYIYTCKPPVFEGHIKKRVTFVQPPVRTRSGRIVKPSSRVTD